MNFPEPPESTTGDASALARNPAESMSSDVNPAISDALALRGREAAMSLMQAVSAWEKYRDQIDAVTDLDAFLFSDFSFMVDYLRLRFQTGKADYRSLYVGEKIRQAYYGPQSSVDEQLARRSAILEAETRGLLEILGKELAPDDLRQFAAEMQQIARILTTRSDRTLEVLFVGDCLYLDVTAFLMGSVLDDGVSINPTLVMTHQPADLRNELRRLAGQRFDLVFFSPFSYEFAGSYNRLQWWHQGALPAAVIRQIAQESVQEAVASLDLLIKLFDCPVRVHNSANIRRHGGELPERIKDILSWRARRAGRRQVNDLLAQKVAERRAAGFEQLFLFDEAALLQRHGERGLGQVFYNHDSRHPAALGRWVAGLYRDLIFVRARLSGRKLIVCDLDNTLWKGVIGEGRVEHYTDRQRILLQLKSRGVVLAIASKNDPRNVRWDGAMLQAQDFVSSQISWDPKVIAIRRIAQHLNLKSKDFVFIDDRPDERALVQGAMPEVLVLDADDERCWRLLEQRGNGLVGADDGDRTAMYRERDARDAFLQSVSVEEEDPVAAFSQLGLTVQIRSAGHADLKRVVELVNRTNQFNTCGSRISLREATAWIESVDHEILVIECSDRFGSMGTISVCVVHRTERGLNIPVFVLSCRVFGYGIERVILNTVKSLAERHGAAVIGPTRETAHNDPGRRVYPDNGFVLEASDSWVWRSSDGIRLDDAVWLAITRALQGPLSTTGPGVEKVLP